MEKRVTRIYFIILLIGMLFAVFATVSASDNIYTRIKDKDVAIWDDRMEMTQEGDTYYYKTTVPLGNTNEKVIVYNTVHMYLEVLVDGNKIYELKADKGGAVKTTGFCWNVISLEEEDAGKEIVFRVTPAYNGGKPQGNFFYGTYREIEHKILKERILSLVLDVMIALAGIIILIYGFFVVKKGQHAETIMQFAIFATMLGFWSLGETQVLDLFFPCSILIVFMSHLTLMTMTIPFMLFLRHMYHSQESKLWSFCCYINSAVIFVRVFLQLIRMYDLRETLVLTHLCLLMFVVVIVVMSIREIVHNELTRQIKLNSVCVLVIVASTVLELAIYHFSNKSTPLGSMGFLFYIAVMGIENVRKSRILMEQARESALYRKLAFTDELTGLSNRTAFKEDLEKRIELDETTGEETILPTVLFMFDLNDLKKCNDTYGHDYGDKYIRMAAEALKRIFTVEGKCYRIGGDEFCAWTPYVSQYEIDEKLERLEQLVKELNSREFVVTVSIAVGYAVYQESKDIKGLYSTMKRADAMMYKKKQEYKKNNAGI